MATYSDYLRGLRLAAGFQIRQPTALQRNSFSHFSPSGGAVFFATVFVLVALVYCLFPFPPWRKAHSSKLHECSRGSEILILPSPCLNFFVSWLSRAFFFNFPQHPYQ